MENIVQSKSKYVCIPPRKARLVADMVRGRKAIEALDILKYTNKESAKHIRKCLVSAVSNAENNNKLDKKDLYIVEIRIDEAPMYKRGRAVARGRYHRILKRNCHILIKVSDDQHVLSTKGIKQEIAAEKIVNIEESETKKDKVAEKTETKKEEKKVSKKVKTGSKKEVKKTKTLNKK